MTDHAQALYTVLESMLLTDYRLPEGAQSPAHVMAHVASTCDRLRDYISQSGALLDGWLYPLLDHPTTITDAQEADLYALAQALFQPAHHINTNLALDIYTALVKRARAAGDTDRLIANLYWRGLSMFYLDRQLYSREMLETFMEAASYRATYRDIASTETRMYINRSLGNIYVTLAAHKEHIGAEPILAAMDDAMAFWNDPEIRAFDPDMPWERFVYSVHQNTCSMLQLLRARYRDDISLAERVYSSARHVNKYKDEFYGKTLNAHNKSLLQYYLTCARYHSGRASAREAGEKFLAMFRSVEAGDYSLDATTRKTHMSMCAIYYLGEDPTYPKEALEALKGEIINDIVAYVAKLPCDASQFTVNAMLGDFIIGMSQLGYPTQFVDMLLELTTFRHLPTYVHSLMVSWLTEALCRYILRVNPAYLVGIADTQSVNDIRDNPDKCAEILDMARISGLCHDVGKSTYINSVSFYSRRLSPNEMRTITSHADKGYDILKNLDYSGVAEVARGHHKWYDGTGGYPGGYDHRISKYRALIDIIAVCDTIEAATDLYGRPYRHAKSLTQTLAEIHAGAGTQYAPTVSDALKDPALVEEIRVLLDEKRAEAYYTAYQKVYGK